MAIEDSFAAPVSCSAIRKSDAARTPRASPFGMSSTVGLPAPMHSAMWSKPIAQASSIAERRAAAEADAAEMRELRAPLQQQAHELQVVLVPAHGDAVFGDAAEPGHHPIVEVLEQRSASRTGADGSKPSGSIFRPSIATTVWPSFIR